MKLAIGADHGGYELKEILKPRLEAQGHQLIDVGAHSYEKLDDYPDFAAAVARTVASGEAERGILICGSGAGACVAANKIKGARAALLHDSFSAHQSVEDDDANVCCLGARVTGVELAFDLLSIYLKASFSGEERHRRRLDKVKKLENEL